MKNYYELEGFEHVYLEDSFVLDIREAEGVFELLIDAVLTEDHPDYHAPGPDSQYCYARAEIVFREVEKVRWLERNDHGFTDASGETDYGNIDFFMQTNREFYLGGDWGEVRIRAGSVGLDLMKGAKNA